MEDIVSFICEPRHRSANSFYSQWITFRYDTFIQCVLPVLTLFQVSTMMSMGASAVIASDVGSVRSNTKLCAAVV